MRNIRRFSTEAHIAALKNKYDASQVAQMRDSLTLVDFEDNVLGPASKVNAHLKSNLALENGKPMANFGSKLGPHRAFSLFLFNSKNELLLQ